MLNVGIDLGTTNTVVYYMSGDIPVKFLIDNEQIMPSAVFVNDDDSFIVGKDAVTEGVFKPWRLITSSKTKLDNDVDVYYPDLDKERYSFDKRVSPTDVAAIILKKVYDELKRTHVAAEDEKIMALVTVPANFTSTAVNNTKTAVKEAGFLLYGEMINEPTAAAMSYYKTSIKEDSLIFVCDFGGGTLDLTSLVYRNSFFSRVGKPGGDDHLGGDDIDNAIAMYFIEYIKNEIGVDLECIDMNDKDMTDSAKNNYRRARNVIMGKAIECKIALSTAEKYVVQAPGLMYFNHNGKNERYDFNFTMTRKKMEEVCSDIFNRFRLSVSEYFTGLVVDKYINDMNEYDEILLVGGSSQIPKVAEILEDIVGRTPKLVPNPLTCVAEGACIQAGVQPRRRITVSLNVSTSRTVGIMSGEEYVEIIIANNAREDMKDTVIELTANGKVIPLSDESGIHVEEDIGAADESGRFILNSTEDENITIRVPIPEGMSGEMKFSVSVKHPFNDEVRASKEFFINGSAEKKIILSSKIENNGVSGRVKYIVATVVNKGTNTRSEKRISFFIEDEHLRLEADKVKYDGEFSIESSTGDLIINDGGKRNVELMIQVPEYLENRSSFRCKAVYDDGTEPITSEHEFKFEVTGFVHADDTLSHDIGIFLVKDGEDTKYYSPIFRSGDIVAPDTQVKRTYRTERLGDPPYTIQIFEKEYSIPDESATESNCRRVASFVYSDYTLDDIVDVTFSLGSDKNYYIDIFNRNSKRTCKLKKK